MGRLFSGAKAKAYWAKRNRQEERLKQRASDNDSIVTLLPPELEAIRTTRTGRAPRDWRVAAIAKMGKQFCDHCRWSPPTESILHAHHVVPLSCGGADALENIITLCPNCHAIAHYVSQRTNLTRTYSGPRTPEQLRKWMWAAKFPDRLKSLQRAHMLAHVTPILSALRA